MFHKAIALAMLVGTIVGPSALPSDVPDAPSQSVPAPAIAVPAPLPAEPDGGHAPEHGVFRLTCEFSHRAPDDPIVHPGHEGMAHSHDFLGNRGTDAHSTYDDMIDNRSSCDRAGDHAAYWLPTLSNDGEPVRPGGALVYYRTGGLGNKESIRPMPRDLKVIVGNAASTGPQDTRMVSWACARPGPDVELNHLPATCGDLPLRVQFTFPNCWDGERLDSRDHQSHVAYSWEDDGDRRACPRSHPVQMPTLEMTVRWRIEGPLDGVELASGPTHTAHADFWTTWVPAGLAHLTARCCVNGRICT